MPETRMRRAALMDVPAIIALLADDALGRLRESTAVPLDPRYVEAFQAIDRDPNQLLAVMVDAAGGVIGCLQLSFLPGLSHRGAWRGQIEAVRIDAAERGRQLGHQMLIWAIDRCRERGCRMVQLTTNKARLDAQRFYRALGFEASHEGMKLDLP
jgi:ribosomal protein S18 acetylase RimI-like enzyme